MAVIDCDVHCVVPSIDALLPYLADHWREYVAQSHFKGPQDTWYPPAPTSAAPGTKPEKGPPGSDLGLIQRHLDATGAEIAILNCAYAIDGIHNNDLEVAMARAVNEWLRDHWLAKDARLRASLMVPVKQPEKAAEEIERFGREPGFVQVFLPIRSAATYGKRIHHPIWDAIVRNDLVAGLHFGGAPGGPPTSVGWTSYYLEEYAGMAQAFQSQLMSMIVEGVFDAFPTLRVSCVEGGWAWLPAFLWRFDKDWKGLRREVPWNSKVPTAYVRENVRFTLQPLDGPEDPARLRETIDEELLLFSTDYPHLHDAPPDGLSRKILYDNAKGWYRL